MNKFEALFSELKDCESIFITSDINRRYYSGMKSTAGQILAFPDKAYLLIDFRYIEKARKTVTDCEVILLENLKKQCAELMNKHNAKSVSIESASVTINELGNIKNIFDGFEVDSSSKLSDVITMQRCVKSDDEVNKILKAQRIAEQGFLHMLDFIKVGRTEKEIALELDYFMLRNGAEALSFDTIALTGSDTSLPHGVPSDTKVCENSFVLLDYGAVYEGYHSDMTRTVCVGTPSEKMRTVYNIVLEAQKKALSFVKAGITGREIDKTARDIIDEKGYKEYFGHGLGHGVGLEIHEYPNASPSFDRPVPCGSVLTVEPGIYLPGEFGVRIEDFVLVEENGCTNLTLADKNLICLN